MSDFRTPFISRLSKPCQDLSLGTNINPFNAPRKNRRDRRCVSPASRWCLRWPLAQWASRQSHGDSLGQTILQKPMGVRQADASPSYRLERRIRGVMPTMGRTRVSHALNKRMHITIASLGITSARSPRNRTTEDAIGPIKERGFGIQYDVDVSPY